MNTEARHLQKHLGEEEEVSPALLLAGTQSHRKLEINVGGALFVLCIYECGLNCCNKQIQTVLSQRNASLFLAPMNSSGQLFRKAG